MNHHHRKILHAVFAHPVPANLDFTDLTHALEHLGAEIDNKTGNRVEVALKGQKAVFHRNNHSVPKTEVMQIKKFLEGCGITAEAFPI